MSIEGNTLKVNKIILTKPDENGWTSLTPNLTFSTVSSYGQIGFDRYGVEQEDPGEQCKLVVNKGNGLALFSSDDTTRTYFNCTKVGDQSDNQRLVLDASQNGNNFDVEHDNILRVCTSRAWSANLTGKQKRFALIDISRTNIEGANDYPIIEVGELTDASNFTQWAYILSNGNAKFQDLSYTNIAQTSDKSKKKSIYNLNDSYDKLFDELKPKRYKWKEKSWGENQMLGFIANDIKESLDKSNIDDQSIILGEEGNYSFSSTQIIPLNTWQIQKLKKRVSDLEERLAKLENKE